MRNVQMTVVIPHLALRHPTLDSPCYGPLEPRQGPYGKVGTEVGIGNTSKVLARHESFIYFDLPLLIDTQPLLAPSQRIHSVSNDLLSF